MTAFSEALERLPQYNDLAYNASTNPYGMDDNGYLINIPQMTADIAVVCGEVASAATIVGDLETEIAALGAITAEIETLAPLAADIEALAAIAAAISSVAAIAASVSAVAANAADISAVADNETNIDAVAGAVTNINLVAAALTNINLVAAALANIAIVAGIAAAVTTTAGIAADVTSLAALDTEITTLSALDTELAALGPIAADITAVAAIDDDVTALVAIDSDVTALAPRAADIALLADIEDGTVATDAIQVVATNATDVVNVAANITDVGAVADALAAVNTVAGIASDVTAAAAIAADIGTVADNAAAIDTAATNIAAIIAAPDAAEAAQLAARRIEFDSSTTDADPGAGAFRLSFAVNSAAMLDTGTLYIDLADANATDITAYIESWDDAVSDTGRGDLTLTKATDPTVNLTLRVTGSVVTATGYRKVPVTILARGGTIADGEEFTLLFNKSGADGDDGEGAGNVNPTGTINSGRLASFADGTGTVIQDSGVAVADLATTAALADLFDTTADTLDDITAGATNKHFTATDETKLDGIEAAADVTDAVNVGSSIHGATAKTTPVDADTMPLIDSAASNVLKKVTWANIKATLKTYFDTLYATASHSHAFSVITGRTATLASDITGLTAKTTPVDADQFAIIDSADSSALKKTTWANLKTLLGAIYQPLAANLTAIAGLTSAADKIAYFTGSGTAALADFGSQARTFLAATTASAQRTALGLIIGTDVQAHDADTAKTDVAQTWSAAQQFGQVAGTVTALAALDFNCALGNEFTKTNAASQTYTVSSVPSGKAYEFRLILTYTSGTITWFSGVNWAGGTAPTFTGGKVYEVIFTTFNGGTTWRGAAAEYAA